MLQKTEEKVAKVILRYEFYGFMYEFYGCEPLSLSLVLQSANVNSSEVLVQYGSKHPDVPGVSKHLSR